MTNYKKQNILMRILNNHSGKSNIPALLLISVIILIAGYFAYNKYTDAQQEMARIEHDNTIAQKIISEQFKFPDSYDADNNSITDKIQKTNIK
ncbi:MAG: hypothetical protein GY868_06925 [Deltaproteobacteria bacterium]|nr:hypothetical protein [Deltaproteobacteria bacterium]